MGETVSRVGSVDGPRGSSQMEIDHGRLEKGVLNQELSNGLSQHGGSGEESVSLECGALAKHQQNHQHHHLQTQRWGPGNPGVAESQQQEEADWRDPTPGSLVSNVDMEDARTLVAFSSGVNSLPPCSVPQSPQLHTAQLYEKFHQEMAMRENGEKQKHGSAVDQNCTPADLHTLQMALNQARRGHKPPTCDCDGPDCPDYLEWLENKIKMATSSQDNGLCKIRSGDPQTEQHYQNKLQPPVSGANNSCGFDAQSHKAQPLLSRPYGPLPPIPCSPSVLSIAKERNVSLQTAIAIEALTQLSGTGGTGEPTPGNSQHRPSPNISQPQDGMQTSLPGSTSSSSPLPQTAHPGNFQQNPASWEQHRPQSQGSTHHASQYKPSNSPFQGSHANTPNPGSNQWQQNTGASCEKNSPRNPWMMLNSDSRPRFPHSPNGSNDPMSELKQLLGDSTGKYTGNMFKFPTPSPKHKDNHSVMPHIKQEVENGSYPGDLAAAMSQYGIINGQHHFQSQQFGPSIRHSTQAALQQHLHHKRNLFSSSHGFSPRNPTCQTLAKWWPQPTPESALGIKQEAKEPKKKRTPQNSPLLKQSMGGLIGSLGPPLPKPKQIVIKKTKQKASLPLFLPQSQIAVQKPSIAASIPPPSYFTSPLSGTQADLSPHTSSQVAVSQEAPVQSQESILNSSSISTSGNTNPSSTSGSVLVPSALERLAQVSGLAAAEQETQATTSTSQPTPSLSGLNSMDPKFEDLIRQFEEEFGDTLPSEPPPDAPEQGPVSLVVTESNQNSNSGQNKTQSPSTEQCNAPTAPSSQSEPIVKQDEGQSKETSTPSNQLPTIKQENEECEVDIKPSEQILSDAGEYYLKDQKQSLMEQLNTMCTPPTKRMKIESSGGVTVLSTSGFLSTGEEDTPKKEEFPTTPSLKGFLESPLRYLDTPTKSLLNTPVKDDEPEFPLCDCVEQILEKDEGPYYNHLGSGPTVPSIRELMEQRFGQKGEAIRIEKVVFTGREGKSSQGCPIAKWVIRRGSEKEKVLCLVRQRAGHHCANAVIVVVILAWEGIPRTLSDRLYQEVSDTITKFGNPTSRRCGLNDDRTCACQGKNPETCGASFSFGCSWSMYFNGCKYARSKAPRKFRLQGEHPKEEELIRDNFQELATTVAPLYKRLAPQAYANQCAYEKVAPDCRLGLKEGRPFSGITACMDFCAHAHKDQHNLKNGCTVVCTLTKEDNRAIGVIPEDEQLHVLPLYKVSVTDEFGSEENQRLKIQTGAIQVLSNFRREVRKLPEPAKSCRQRRLEAKKAASEKKNKKQQLAETPEKTMKTEVSLQPQKENKAIPKQEVKPNIKREVDRFRVINGAVAGYPTMGNGKMCPDPYNMNGAYTSYPIPYARGGLPSSSQSPAHSAINGFHPSLQGTPYNYYNYPPNALLPSEVLSYEGRNGSWPKASAAEQKTDVQGLQSRLAPAYSSHLEQQQQGANLVKDGYPHQSASAEASALTTNNPSVPPDQVRHGTPVIKQEPMDVPLYDNRTDGHVRSCPSTPGVTPQPDIWPGHKPNGVLASKGWDGNLRPGPPHSPFTPDKQKLHQHHHSLTQSSQYAQQQQWPSYPGTPVVSPAPSASPVMRTGPSPAPSPHPATPQHWASPAPSPQPNPWGPKGAIAYSAAQLRQGTPVGAFPDKMFSEAESRSSTPQGALEKAWRSGGASAAGSNPSPAPEGRLFPEALQKVNGQACWESEADSEHDPEEEEVFSDSEHNFLDPNIGGVAVAPAHGSVIIECARRELHATTPLKKPDRGHPSRISLVFYQHKNLNQPAHGLALWEAKMKLLAERARQRQQEAALLGLSQDEIKAYAKKRKWADGLVSPMSELAKEKREGVATRLSATQHTTTTVTASPYAFTQLTGPYSRFI